MLKSKMFRTACSIMSANLHLQRANVIVRWRPDVGLGIATTSL